jgi:hypothetical protein
MLGSRTLLRPGDQERTGGLRRGVPGPDHLPKPGLLDDSRAGTLPSAQITPVSKHPVGSPAIQEPSSSSCSISASWPGLPLTPAP